MIKPLLTLGLALLLSACGGGGSSFNPSVSAIQPRTLQYGQNAVILVGGRFLRADMKAETGSCTNPSFRSDSTPDVAILTCKVTATGVMPVVIRAATGEVLGQASFNVPQPQVGIITDKGSIVVELNPGAAPITVNNFLGYVSRGFYSSTLFQRVIAGFVVQGGGYTTGLVKKAGQLDPIVLESNKGLSNVRGTIAMARTPDPNSANSEFYFNLIDNLNLDYQSSESPGFAVFGKVISGMDVVDNIASVPTGTFGEFENVPLTDVVIKLVVQLQ